MCMYIYIYIYIYIWQLINPRIQICHILKPISCLIDKYMGRISQEKVYAQLLSSDDLKCRNLGTTEYKNDRNTKLWHVHAFDDCLLRLKSVTSKITARFINDRKWPPPLFLASQLSPLLSLKSLVMPDIVPHGKWPSCLVTTFFVLHNQSTFYAIWIMNHSLLM